MMIIRVFAFTSRSKLRIEKTLNKQKIRRQMIEIKKDDKLRDNAKKSDP